MHCTTTSSCEQNCQTLNTVLPKWLYTYHWHTLTYISDPHYVYYRTTLCLLELTMGDAAENIGINNTHLPHQCDICNRDLTLATEYYWCSECPATFFWCKECFYRTNKHENTPEEQEVTDTQYGGRVIRTTKDGHIHKFVQYKVQIRTPSKRQYDYE